MRQEPCCWMEEGRRRRKMLLLLFVFFTPLALSWTSLPQYFISDWAQGSIPCWRPNMTVTLQGCNQRTWGIEKQICWRSNELLQAALILGRLPALCAMDHLNLAKGTGILPQHLSGVLKKVHHTGVGQLGDLGWARRGLSIIRNWSTLSGMYVASGGQGVHLLQVRKRSGGESKGNLLGWKELGTLGTGANLAFSCPLPLETWSSSSKEQHGVCEHWTLHKPRGAASLPGT